MKKLNNKFQDLKKYMVAIENREAELIKQGFVEQN